MEFGSKTERRGHSPIFGIQAKANNRKTKNMNSKNSSCATVGDLIDVLGKMMSDGVISKDTKLIGYVDEFDEYYGIKKDKLDKMVVDVNSIIEDINEELDRVPANYANHAKSLQRKRDSYKDFGGIAVCIN